MAWAEDQRVVLFSGQLDAITLGSWGSGTIELDDEETYLEHGALVIETTGFFEGGRLDLRQPVPAERILGDPEGGYLRLVVKTKEPEPEVPEMPEGMYPPGFGEFPMGPGEEPGFAAPPEGPFMGEMHPPDFHPEDYDMPREEWHGPGVGVPPPPPREIEQLRVLLVTDTGAVDSGPIMLAMYPEIVDDWKLVVIPMTAFSGPVDIADGEIKRVAIFGDTEERFWVGDVSIGYEERPLIADAGPAQRTVRVDEVVEFEAAPQPAGVSASYTWDFDHLDGIEEEGYAREVTWTFATPGIYLVTLTVSDPAGQKVDRFDRVYVQVVE